MDNLKKAINGLCLLLCCLAVQIAQADDFPWERFTVDKLQKNIEEHRITLIGFDAKWCGTCRLLNRVTFSNKKLITFMVKHKITCLHVDMTKRNLFHSKLLSLYGGFSIPYHILLDGNGRIYNRFQGLFRADELIDAVKELQTPHHFPDDINVVRQADEE